MIEWTGEVPGDPVPKGRPRLGAGGHTITPARTRAAEKRFAQYCYYAGLRPFGGPLVVYLDFELATRRRCDLDNLEKLALDALNGVAWRDDAQVEEIHATLTRGVPPGRTRIRIHERHTGTLFGPQPEEDHGHHNEDPRDTEDRAARS